MLKIDFFFCYLMNGCAFCMHKDLHGLICTQNLYLLQVIPFHLLNIEKCYLVLLKFL